MPDFDVQQVVEDHRFDKVGRVCSCGVLCGVVCDGLSYEQHLAAVIVPAVTQQVRELHRITPHEGAPGWLWCHGCRHSVSAEAKVCPTVLLLDSLDAAARSEQP